MFHKIVCTGRLDLLLVAHMSSKEDGDLFFRKDASAPASGLEI